MTKYFLSFFQKTARLEENIYSVCHLQIQCRYSWNPQLESQNTATSKLLNTFNYGNTWQLCKIGLENPHQFCQTLTTPTSPQ